MKRLLNFLYGNWYGMSVCWCATGLLSLAVGLAFGGDRRLAALVNAVLFLHVVVMTLLALSAPVVSLCRRRWGRACAQIGAGLLVGLLYLAGLSLVSIAAMFSEANMDTFRSEDQAWRETKITDELPFSVGYRPAHPFLAEYEKRLTFRSGRHVPLRLDSGGAGRFAVYALGTNTFYLVEGLEHEFMRSEYRVDAAKETAEMLCGDAVWIPIPEDALEFESWGADGFSVKTPGGSRHVERGVPARGTLEGRRFLGYISTRGRFEKGGTEPVLARQAKVWNSMGLPDSLPFSLEREQGDGDRGGSFFGMRVAFPSGKWLGLWPSWRGEARDVSVYRMGDGRHLLVFQEGLRDEMLYRVDSAAGAVSAHGYGFWARLPDGTLSVSGLGRSGTEESPTGMSLTVSTERGKEQVSGTERAAEPYLGCTYLGRLEAPGRLVREENPVFAEALARTKTAGAAWDGMAEHGRFTAELERLFNADRAAFARLFESDPRWHVRTFRDSGRVERRCAFRVFSSGDESCLVRVLLNGQKPGSKLFAKGRCRDPRAGWYAASRALLAELEKAGRAAE